MSKSKLLSIAIVATAWLATIASPAAAQSPSTACPPSSTVFDGYLGSSYAKLRVEQPDADHAWVCFQVDDGLALQQAGQVVVTAPDVSADPPDDDEDVDACAEASGNQVPGEHPMDTGVIGGNDPVPHQVTYLIDSYANDDEVWICLALNELEKRVMLSLPGAMAPDVDLFPDSPAPAAPGAASWPAGLPSASCQQGAGGTHTPLINAAFAGGEQVWLEVWQPDLDQLKLCVRSQGAQGTGGVLSVDASESGLVPVPELSGDTSPCTVNVFTRDQGNGPHFSIDRSPTGSNPTSVCVSIEGEQPQRFSVGTEGESSEPEVDFTPDPGTPGPPGAPDSPQNTSPPSVSGTARVGETLTADKGTWTGTEPINYAYQWQRCDSGGSNCSDIAGAFEGTYELVPADAGLTLRIRVTATNAADSASETSAATNVVTQIPTNTSPPTISGEAEVGETLTADEGTWGAYPAPSFSYQWRRCDTSGGSCSDISGGTSTDYTLVSADAGSTIRVVVTATNSEGLASATSTATDIIVEVQTPPSNTTPPAISGAPIVSETLTTDQGTWAGTAPITYAYQWQRCDPLNLSACVDIPNATSTSYTLRDLDNRASVRVKVTASNTADSVAAVSASTDPVVMPLAQKDGLAGCFVTATPVIGPSTWLTSVSTGCSPYRGLAGAGAILVTPDGKDVYVASFDNHALVALRRNVGTGELGHSKIDGQCYGGYWPLTGFQLCPSGSWGLSTGITVGQALVSTPDSSIIYISDFTYGRIHGFPRNPNTGELSDLYGSGVYLADTLGNDVMDMVVSPDGNNLYAAEEDAGGIATFDIGSTGSLTQKSGTSGCVDDDLDHNYACAAGGTHLRSPHDLAISPDGKNVYLSKIQSTSGGELVTIFDRNLSTGVLSNVRGVNARGAGVRPRVTVSPDGENLYLISGGGNSGGGEAVLIYDRNTTTGALTQKTGTDGCISHAENSDGCGSKPQPASLWSSTTGVVPETDIAATPDGEYVYTLFFSKLIVWARDPTTGKLTPPGGGASCLNSPIVPSVSINQANPDKTSFCPAARGMTGAGRLAISPDSQNLYTTHHDASSVGVFDRVVP